jgi:hypothetical protein
MAFARLLQPLGYTSDPQVTKEYGSPTRQDLLMRYHGLGYCQVVGRNPKISGNKNYFIGVIGGCNGLEAAANETEFRHIGDPGTRYFSLDQLCRAVLETYSDNPNSYSSVPN